jgi:glutamate dehydrogenase (NAD(P)+)
MYATMAALREAGRDLRGTRIAVQGFGKVGGLAAQFLHDAGCSVVAVSDVKGGVYNSRGLNPVALLRHIRAGAESVVGYPGTDPISNEELLELDVDVLVPAALEGVIHESNADKVRADFIVEGANGPTTPNADQVLDAKGVTVVPDILANAGGVAVSYFEWVQDLQAYWWTEDEVNDRLRRMMDTAYDEVSALASAHDLSLRSAAQMIGVGRVADAHRTRGLYP